MRLPNSIFTRTLLISAISINLTWADGLSQPVAAEPETADTPIAEKSGQPAEPEVAPSQQLIFANGDRLSGQTLDLTDQRALQFKADALRQPAEFTLDNLLRLNLGGLQSSPSNEQTLARVQLQPRFSEKTQDTIIGRIVELTDDSVKLDTWYGGNLSIKRSMISSINMISNAPGNFYGPNSLAEWSQQETKKRWSFYNSTLSTQGDASIGRDVKLTDKSHTHFRLNWERSMRFRIQLYSNDAGTDQSSAHYEIHFINTYAYLRTHGKSAAGRAFQGGGRGQRLPFDTSNNTAAFDIFADRKAGMFHIYIDGKYACVLQSSNPNPDNLGTGLTFIAEKKHPLEVSDITVTPWNGNATLNEQAAITPPASKTKDEGDDAKKAPDTEDKPSPEAVIPHTIVLSNGDTVSGKVGKVENDTMQIETKYTPINIPLNRIQSLSLGNDGEQPIMKNGDIRAWFHQGGHVTLKLETLKDGKVSGYSQAVGNVSFDLSAFRKIDFQIYNPEANKLRAKIH